MAYARQRIKRTEGVPLAQCVDGRGPTASQRDLRAAEGVGALGYRRHRAEDTVLYGVVEQHADAFVKGQGASACASIAPVSLQL